MVEKGSIAVDGVSLTVVAVDDDGFSVSLIPETLERTTLGARRAGRAGQPGGGRGREVRGEAGGAMSEPVRDRSRRRSRTSAPAGWSSSATTRTARTRATSRSRRSSRRPRRSTSWRKEGRGLICLALTPDRCDELGLDLMAAKNESPFETAFTVSIEAREGVTTGISAADRARTIQVAIDPRSRAARPRPARPRLPAEGQARRRARAHRPDRGGRRPRAARRASTRPA